MSQRDDELWGMYWRFSLVMTTTGIAAAIAGAALNGNLLLQVVVVTGILLLPMYLANRARSRAAEE